MPQDSATDVGLEPLLTDRQTEAVLNVHPGFLAKDRLGKARIPFIKLGRAVRYRPADVRAYLAAQLRTSTSDTGRCDRRG